MPVTLARLLHLWLSAYTHIVIFQPCLQNKAGGKDAIWIASFTKQGPGVSTATLEAQWETFSTCVSWPFKCLVTGVQPRWDRLHHSVAKAPGQGCVFERAALPVFHRQSDTITEPSPVYIPVPLSVSYKSRRKLGFQGGIKLFFVCRASAESALVPKRGLVEGYELEAVCPGLGVLS